MKDKLAGKLDQREPSLCREGAEGLQQQMQKPLMLMVDYNSLLEFYSKTLS